MKKFAHKNRKFLLSAVFAAALALAGSPALAQPGYGGAQQGMQAQQPAKQDFDEQTLQKFASTANELGKIQNEFREKLQGVQDQEKAMAMQKEMNAKMLKAVQDEGLEVETYNHIANQMSVDAELRNRVEDMLSQQ